MFSVCRLIPDLKTLIFPNYCIRILYIILNVSITVFIIDIILPYSQSLSFQCECSDDFCLDQKDRSEICRPQVERVMNENILPCGLARYICTADAICSKALEYYNLYCKAMFHGKKCTSRCYNSIDILRRQDKAKKLETCRCAGEYY